MTIRRMRQLVWLTLLAWLFGLAAGVVNACVLSLPGPVVPSSAQSVQGRAAHHGVAGFAHGSVTPDEQEHEQEHEQEDEQDSGKDTCLKFCDEESTALSKTKTYGADTPVALVELGDLRGTAVPIKCIGNRISLQRPVAQGPPLVIRFLRLTL
jgi:hypothetical protein